MFGINFLRPEYLNLGWLWVVMGVGMVWSFRLFLVARRRLAGALRSATSRPSSMLRRGIQWLLLWLALGCLIVALARPQSTRYRQEAQLRHMDAILLLDTSPSMRAQDISPSRIYRATEVIGEFIQKKLPGDRIGLISFADNSLVLSYLTADPKNLLFYMDYLREDRALQYGTNIGGALKSAMGMLSRQAESDPDEKKNKKVFILLSDGEDHGEEMKDEVREMIRRQIPVYCIGIGSREGSLIPVGEVDGQPRYLTGKDGQPILTTFDESTLEDAAAKTGGRYYRAKTGGEMLQAFNDIFVKAREVAGYRQVTEQHEHYGAMLLAAFGLCLLRSLI